MYVLCVCVFICMCIICVCMYGHLSVCYQMISEHFYEYNILSTFNLLKDIFSYVHSCEYCILNF